MRNEIPQTERVGWNFACLKVLGAGGWGVAVSDEPDSKLDIEKFAIANSMKARIFACKPLQFMICASADVDVKFWRTVTLKGEKYELYKVCCPKCERRGWRGYNEWVKQTIKILDKYKINPALEGCFSPRNRKAAEMAKSEQVNTALLEELTESKIRVNLANAEKIELKNAVMRGELIAVENVNARWAESVSNVKGKLLALPDKLTPQLYSAGLDPGGIRSLLKNAIYEVLTDLAEEYSG